MTRLVTLLLLLASCTRADAPPVRPSGPPDAGAATSAIPAPAPRALGTPPADSLTASLDRPDGVLGKVCPGDLVQEKVVVPAWTAGVKVGGWTQDWCVKAGARADGEFEAVSRHGLTVATGAWKDGRPDGEWRYFHDDGEAAMQGGWKAGRAQGVWTFWPRGKEPLTSCFAAGERVDCP